MTFEHDGLTSFNSDPKAIEVHLTQLPSFLRKATCVELEKSADQGCVPVLFCAKFLIDLKGRSTSFLGSLICSLLKMGFHLDFHWDFCLNKYSQTSTANKIYAMKPKESPNENPNEQPFWQ